jgi:putative transport protein
MGTATDAINGLALPEADRGLFVAHIAVADAVCYIFGYAGVIIFATVIAPALLKIDLRTEALKFEHALGMTRAKPDLASAWRKFELRAYRLAEGSPLAGLTVAAAEARVPEHRLVHPPAPPRRTHPGSRARHDTRGGRRDRALRAAPDHR